MPPTSSSAHVFSQMRNFFDEIEGEKTAAVKAADTPKSEPGSIGGETSHPSKNVDDRLVGEQTGSRYKENTSDVNDAVGAAGIQKAPEATFEAGHSQQQKRQFDIGTSNHATGEDTGVERDFKGTKEDPGTTSKMRADDGEKYGNDMRQWPITKLATHLGALGNPLMADISNGKLTKVAAPGDPGMVASRGLSQPVLHPQHMSNQLGANPTILQTQQAPAPTVPEPTDPTIIKAAQEGYELAKMLGYGDEKTAASGASQVVEQVIGESVHQADLVGQYLHAFDFNVKRAAGEDPAGGEGESHSDPGDAASGAGDASSMTGGPGPDGGAGGGDAAGIVQEIQSLPPEIQQQVLAELMQGAGGMAGPGGMGGDPNGMGGGMPPQGGGGGDPMAAMGGGGMPPGGDPMAGGGGGMPPQGGGGDPSQMGAVDELSSGMQDMGVDPNQMEQMAPKAASVDHRRQMVKIARLVRERRLSGKHIYKAATTPEDRAVRLQATQYLAELLGTAH